MKLMHLSDLHIGKRVNDCSMIEDQKFILEEILKIVDAESPDAVAIAGDVYDKTVPSAEAVTLLDDFLFALSGKGKPVFIVSGNHDSPERLSFGGRLINKSGVYISPVYSGETAPITLEDEYGKVNFYLLPFIKPSAVKKFFPENEVESFTDAVALCIDKMNVDEKERNVIVAHQFVTGAVTCESEDISVGGADNVDASIFDIFDYVCLGHIHRPQPVGNDRVRYSGTPLKYSFSEANDKKAALIVELKEKGNVSFKSVPLKPLRDMVEIRGRYEELTLRSYYENTTLQSDYLHITLTDENDILNAMANLRVIYKNLLKLDYDNTRTRTASMINGAEAVEQKSPYMLFNELFLKQNGAEMTEKQSAIVSDLIAKIWGGEDETDLS